MACSSKDFIKKMTEEEELMTGDMIVETAIKGLERTARIELDEDQAIKHMLEMDMLRLREPLKDLDNQNNKKEVSDYLEQLPFNNVMAIREVTLVRFLDSAEEDKNAEFTIDCSLLDFLKMLNRVLYKNK